MLKTTLELFIKKTSLKNGHCRLSSTLTAPMQDHKIQSFRTLEADPSLHTLDHLCQFYSLPSSDKQVLFQHGGLPKSFETQAKTFQETCLMIREPSVDIINCLKSIDYSKPAVRFVLYGKKGCGKTLSLAHILHYAYKNNFLIVHVPWVGNWMRRCKDSSNSETKEGFIDLNIDAAAWLLHFKTQNAELLKNPHLKISRDIQWTKRETTLKDSSLLDLIDHGINRIRFASNCVIVLAEEIKKLSVDGVCKTLVAVDGFNAFFYPNTRVYTEKKEVVAPNKITLTEAFLNLTKFDWNNAVIVVTVDEIAIAEKDQISHYPRYLLGKIGFEHLDPFVPVEVSNLSKKEHQSIMDYYRERKWVLPYSGQDEEVYFLSGGNPYVLMNICNSFAFTMAGRGAFIAPASIVDAVLILNEDQIRQERIKLVDLGFGNALLCIQWLAPVDWCSFCRDICEQHLIDNPTVIGGLNEDGTSKVVEIDESKFFHRKYHRGQWREGHWVFGGIERGTGRGFLVEVPDRTAQTLTDIIQEYILPGTLIMSDGWRAYNNIDQIGGGIYEHQVVIHEENFVDPNNAEIHTQNVENMWMRAKMTFRRQFGTSRALFPSYLSEFVWRNQYRDNYAVFGVRVHHSF